MQENNRAELEFMINIGKELAGELDSVGTGSAEESWLFLIWLKL